MSDHKMRDSANIVVNVLTSKNDPNLSVVCFDTKVPSKFPNNYPSTA